MLTYFKIVAVLLAGCLFAGCGKQALPQTSAAQDDAKAKASSDEMLAEDSAKFRAIAEGQAAPLSSESKAINQFPSTAATRETPSTTVAPPQTVTLVTPPPVVPQTFGFDDSPDGLEAKRLLAVFIAHLKDPDSAKFQSVKSASFSQTTGRAFGVCGEVNAKNAYGGYTGVTGFVVFKDSDGSDKMFMEGSPNLEGLAWEVTAKSMGCVPR